MKKYHIISTLIFVFITSVIYSQDLKLKYMTKMEWRILYNYEIISDTQLYLFPNYEERDKEFDNMINDTTNSIIYSILKYDKTGNLTDIFIIKGINDSLDNKVFEWVKSTSKINAKGYSYIILPFKIEWIP